MKKLAVFVLACLAMILMVYIVRTYTRDPDEAINDKPVSSVFQMMDDVHEEHHP